MIKLKELEDKVDQLSRTIDQKMTPTSIPQQNITYKYVTQRVAEPITTSYVRHYSPIRTYYYDDYIPYERYVSPIQTSYIRRVSPSPVSTRVY